MRLTGLTGAFRKQGALFGLQLPLETYPTTTSLLLYHTVPNHRQLPRALIHQCVESSQNTFYVENIARIFSSFIQSNKKKLRQDASNRNLQASEQLLKVIRLHWCCSASCFFSVSGILHRWEGRRRERFQVIGAWGCQVSSAPPPPLQSPNFSLPKHSCLALRLAD